MSESVFQKVSEIIADSKNISADEITLETTFRELDIDSLAALSLVYDFEEAFNVSIPDEEVMKIRKVGDVVESLDQLNVAV
jgi:acyl carrier protein